MPIDDFLRALMRDVGWGFFYGTVNFDSVLGTINHYGTVDLFAGQFNEAFRAAKRNYLETFEAKDLKRMFELMLDDWTNEGFDPYAAPDETGKAYGPKHGSNSKALKRERIVSPRMVGLPGDLPYRSDEAGQKVNRQFADVPQDKPEVTCRAGLRRRSARVQHVRVCVALGRNVESVGRIQRAGQPVLRDDGGIYSPDFPRQRSRGMVHPGVRRNHLGRGRWQDGQAARKGHDEGGRHGGHAGRHPAQGVFPEAVDPDRLGE